MQRFVQLETVIRKAPLGMRFLDLVSGANVSDGLAVIAWRRGTSGPQQVALRWPLSGIYGFRNLLGLHRFETGERPASDWCSSPPDVGEPTADELTDISILRGLLSADESPPAGAKGLCKNKFPNSGGYDRMEDPATRRIPEREKHATIS